MIAASLNGYCELFFLFCFFWEAAMFDVPLIFLFFFLLFFFEGEEETFKSFMILFHFCVCFVLECKSSFSAPVCLWRRRQCPAFFKVEVDVFLLSIF